VDQVEYHLKLVINLWCGAVPAQYTADSQLRDIWAEQVPNLDYDTYGVPRFMKQIYQDPLFASCTSAHEMTPGEFITGGGVQTFSSVYMQLAPCAQTTMLAKVMMPFATASPVKGLANKGAAKKDAAKKPTARKAVKGRG